MRRTPSYVVLLLLSVSLFACSDTSEPIPAYLRIEPFTVNAPGGAAWQKVTEGWLYVNGELLGAYTLPATVPVLAEGESEVLLFPGVKENGILQTPAIYPFLTRFEQTYTLTPPQITPVQPLTAYDDDAVFVWDLARTTFDSESIPLENRDSDPATGFELVSAGAFSGRSVRMAVDTAHRLIEIATNAQVLPTSGGQQVWLEMHYKNDIPFSVWLLGARAGAGEVAIPVYQFNISEDWNKIYFNITGFVANNQQDNYRLFFQTRLPQNTDGSFPALNGAVFLDNLRLIHF